MDYSIRIPEKLMMISNQEHRSTSVEVLGKSSHFEIYSMFQKILLVEGSTPPY